MRTEGSDQTDLIVQNGCRKIFALRLTTLVISHILIIGYNQCYQGSTMPNFDVEFFEKSDGTFPAEEFILSQDVKMQAKLFRLLELLEVNGNNLREPYSKSLDDGIF